jgi:hypothetical protein
MESVEKSKLDGPTRRLPVEGWELDPHFVSRMRICYSNFSHDMLESWRAGWVAKTYIFDSQLEVCDLFWMFLFSASVKPSSHK